MSLCNTGSFTEQAHDTMVENTETRIAVDAQPDGTSKTLSERGAAMVEYALLLALIAIVAVGAITAFGGGVGAEYDDINAEIDAAINGPAPAAP